MKRLIFLLSLLLISVGYTQQVLDKIIAIVDDKVILASEVTQAAQFLAMQQEIDLNKNQREFERLTNEALTSLINQKLLLIQAKKDTVLADERQVDTYLQQQMQSVIQQLGGEDKVEAYYKSPLSKVRRTFKEQIENNLTMQTVRDQKVMDISVNRREVKEFYKTMKDSLGNLKESVDISHILVETKPGEEARKEAFEKISKIKELILEGNDFAQLAQDYSQDPGSAERGGDLGFMSKGEFVRPFEEAAFKLKPGELSDIVETEFGFHIIRLEDKRGDKIHTRHILISLTPSKEDEVTAANKIKEIYQKLKNGEDFVSLVEQYSDDKSSNKEQGHLGYFEIDQLRNTAKEFVYAITDVKEGQISEPVKTKYGFHILKVNKRDQGRELDLEKDWDRIEQMALEYKKQKEFNQWLQSLKKEVYIKIYRDVS